MNNSTNIKRYECYICTRSPEEIQEPEEEDETRPEGTPKIARILVDVKGVQKSFDICWECSVCTCCAFASTAKYFRDSNNPEPPPKRYA